jgi:hypothetical protein
LWPKLNQKNEYENDEKKKRKGIKMDSKIQHLKSEGMRTKREKCGHAHTHTHTQRERMDTHREQGRERERE